jgi:hypothetical protein
MSTKLIDRAVLERCAIDSGSFGQAAFPEVFYAPNNSMHKAIYDALDAVDERGFPKHRKVVVGAGRGLGKTDGVLLGGGGRRTAYRLAEYLMYITATEDSAIEKTESLKACMVGSDFVREHFGDIRTRPFDGVELEFSKKGYYAYLPTEDGVRGYHGTKIVPRGALQQIRGRGTGAARPDFVIGDDLDDPRRLKTEKRREDARTWWFSDVLPCVSRYNPNWQIVYTGTMTQDDCLLHRLMGLKDWTVVNLDVCTDDFKTTCPEYMSQPELDEIVASHQEAGMMDTFFREYRNKRGVEGAALFKKGFFQYYDEGMTAFQGLQGLETTVIGDPAKTAKFGSCESAIIGVSAVRSYGPIYVRDADSGRWHPDDFYNRVIDMAESLRARKIALEVTGISDHLVWPFKNAMASRGCRAQFVPLEAGAGQGEFSGPGGGKDMRISSLIPLYRQGLIWHNRRLENSKFEKQLLAYVPGLRRLRDVDMIDALGHVTKLMQIGLNFFRPKTGAESRDKRFVSAYERLRRRPGTLIRRPQLVVGYP